MNHIDLHTHSTFSDGTCSPTELVSLGIKANLSALALTDHDTVAGIPEALNAAKALNSSLEIIPGTELSVAHGQGEIHIVGLFIDYTNPSFRQQQQLLQQRREARNIEMIERFHQKGITITMDELTQGNPDTVITRAHFARVLIEKGYVKNAKEAFCKYLERGTFYYVPRKFITKEEAMDIIIKSGGAPILAHPLLYHLSEKEIRNLLGTLKELGLVGIETEYSTFSKADTNFAKSLAREFDLLQSGGSDFHGTNKPDISLGIGRGNLAISEDYLEQIRIKTQKTSR